MTGQAGRIIDINPQNRQVDVLVSGVWHRVDWPIEAALPDAGGWVKWPVDDVPVMIGCAVKWPDPAALHWHQPVPGGQVSRISLLKQRHRIIRVIRDYLDDQDFMELESPLLVEGTTPDLALRSFCVGDRYLVTSTEYQIKRLIAGGASKVYTLTKNFRDDPVSPVHNPEFTMLEWARVGVGLDRIEQDVAAFVCAAAEALSGGAFVLRNGKRIDLSSPWDRRSIQDVILAHTGIDVTGFGASALMRAANAAGLVIRPELADDAIFVFTVLLDHIQQFLGWERPVFLQDWPSFLTSSAAEKANGLTERSELIIAGVEIADGFPSLTDAARQRSTFAREQQKRRETGQPEVSLDHRYLAALDSGLPQGAGMALGVDRLVMLLLGQHDISAVMAFDWDNV